ncbi:MAG: hypothetical protein E6Q97_22540 [Desulfurellales bacterium]|nr:MAG: hypothetical protein E6Q97_22540 [Desulfurellales bacterium]
MSKIEKQLAEATEVTRKRGESDQDYMARLVKGTSELDDASWEKLSPEAQNWFNDAADNLNKKKELPDFPDAAKAEEKKEEPVSRRGSAKKTEEKKDEPAEAKVGDKVTIVTKRDKTIEGEVIEQDADMLVVKDAEGEELEVARDRIKTIEVKAEEKAPRRRKAADEDDPPETPADPKVGDEVKVVTKRGKTITGKVVEIDGDVLVIDDGEGEIEVDPEKAESIEVTKAAAGGKSSKKDDAKADKGKEDKGDKKKISAKANGGVSATGRMRELVCEDPSMSKEDLSAKLKKEGLEFRDNTLDLVYADAQKIISILRDLKKLK